MFQVPVENIDYIRSMRPWVKGVLQNVGLDSCKEMLEDLKDFDPGEKHLHQTSWCDVAPWEGSRSRVRYRSKPYCCGLCEYSTRKLGFFRNHVRRYHQDEAEREQLLLCPDCSFVSRPDQVDSHFRYFHQPDADVQSSRGKVPAKGKSWRSVRQFTCLQCSTSMTSLCCMKKHVLVVHLHDVLSSYVGLRPPEAGEQPEASDDALCVMKLRPPDRYFCKKCSANANSLDALMSHILTSNAHRDLENELRAVISERHKRIRLSKQMAVAPKPDVRLAVPPNLESSAPVTASAPATGPPHFHLPLPPSHQSLAMVQPETKAQPMIPAPVQPSLVQPVTKARPVTPALVQPVTKVQSVTQALEQPLTVSPVQPALMQPLTVTPVQPVTQPVTPTLHQPLTVGPVQLVTKAQPVNPALEQPLTVGPVQPALEQPLTIAPGTSWNFTGFLPTAAQSHVAIVSSSLPVGQRSLTQQPSAPKPAYLTCRAPPNQLLSTPVLPPSQQLGPVNKSVETRVRLGAPPLTQPMRPTRRPMRPGILPAAPPVSSGVLQAASPRVTPVDQVVSLIIIPPGQMTPVAMSPGKTETSRGISTGQVVQSEVLHLRQTALSQAVPTDQTVSFRVLPASQMVSSVTEALEQPAVSGVVPRNQDANSGIQCGQPMASGVLPVGQPVRPIVLQLFECVSTSILPGSQPAKGGAVQNTVLLKTGSVFRKLLPTGGQMNGKPIYLLDPTPVTLSVLSGPGLETDFPSQVPSQVVSSDASKQMTSSVPSLPSQQGLVSTADHSVPQATSPVVDVNPALRQAKQWKSCPVCSVFFPSNVYQVHIEMAHKQSECNSREKCEPEKLAVCAPFLKWPGENVVRCLSCECLVCEEELMDHLLTHGLGCLFCPCTFHDIRGLLEHSRIKHLGKRLSLDYSNRGFQLNLDDEGNLLFPHLDFVTTLPREKLGEREVCLAILAGVRCEPLVPLYVQVRPRTEIVPKMSSKQKLTCPFCCGTFIMADAYNLHLKERHHVMPTVRKTLRSPAFKCAHCFRVYSGNLTLAMITVHLLYCKNAPKDCNSHLQAQPSFFVESRKLQLVNREVIPRSALPVKRKLPDQHVGAEDQKLWEGPSLLKAHKALGPEEGASVVPLKRQRNEAGLVATDDLLQVLVLDPRKYKGHSREQKQQFLRDYFCKKPYPSRKEIELLSSLLQDYKINVASFFGIRRHICMKTMKIHKPSVLLGFDMSELKNVKHRLNFEYEPQK